MNRPIRTRFAPAPTGLMHLGNVRTALINYLFARQKNGTCILRIEDTDAQRNFDPGGKKIMEDLAWLNLEYDETPVKKGEYGPYIQSQRAAFYENRLQYLIERNLVYRCFCTTEDLEQKRQRQISLKLPPRYDRTCRNLPAAIVLEYLEQQKPFIWRFELDPNQTVTIQDMAHDKVVFHLKNFSDLPLTRRDGTFTFMFTNCVDDIAMNISHIFRGEDHLTNTAGQAALFHAFSAPLPTYWHMPIICNIDGKKLSKRDFGFALNDLRHAGYLPEAICNYLGTIGGGSFANEIMSLSELVNAVDFDNITTTGHVRYSTERLEWINHKWINTYPLDSLTDLCLPFLQKVYPMATTIDKHDLMRMIQMLKGDIATIKDIIQALHFYFIVPEVTPAVLEQTVPTAAASTIAVILQQHSDSIDQPEQWLSTIKKVAKEQNIGMKDLFSFIRLALTGQAHGPSVHDLATILGSAETRQRIERLLEHYKQ